MKERVAHGRRLAEWIGVLATALGVMLTPGCGGVSVYAVRTTLAFSDRGETAPEVVVARQRAAVSHPTRIAVLWPTECANETSAEQRGDARSVGRLAAIDCSLEMSAVERVLVSAGYEVFHWDSIRRRAVVQDISPEAAAEQLGIGTLLRINSLERAGLIPGSDARWERDYFRSDDDHRVGEEAVVHPRVANQLDGAAYELENEVVREARLAVTLDVTAVHVPTGEVTWFYRWTHQDTEARAISRRVFVRCQGVFCSRDEGRETEAPPGPRSGSTRALSQQQEDASADRAIHARLLFEALSNLVEQMRALQAGQVGAQ